ncbi:MAG: hypothetical protein AB9891_03510 [Anaerolineaceae bacterium]
MNKSKGCLSCSGMAVKYIVGLLTSSVVGWISGKLVALFTPAAIYLVGAETARSSPWMVSIPMAAIPFGISFVLSLVTGMFFNRRKAVPIQTTTLLMVLPLAVGFWLSDAFPQHGVWPFLPFAQPATATILPGQSPGAAPRMFRPVSQEPTPNPEEICDCETQWLMQARTAHYEENCTNFRNAALAEDINSAICVQAHVDMAEPLVYDPSLQSCVGSYSFWYDWEPYLGEVLVSENTYKNSVDIAALHCQAPYSGPALTEEVLPPPVNPEPPAVSQPTEPAPGPSNIPSDLQDLTNLVNQLVGNPAVPFSGAIAGTLLAWLVSMLRGGTPPPVKNLTFPTPRRPKPGDVDSNGRMFSSIPGAGWVSRQMFNYQKGLLEKGWGWDQKTGKFVVKDGTVNEKGLVYLAGNKAGEGSRWMTPEEYANHKRMVKNGYVLDQTYGYHTPEELRQLKAGDEHWRKESHLDDKAQNAKIKADMDALRAQQEADRAREKYIEYLKEQQGVNEFRMDKAAKVAADDYSTENMVGGVENLSREVITGANPDGSISISSMLIRGGLASLTGGNSEIFYQSVNSLYTMKDAIDRGATGTEAVAQAMGETIIMEGAGRVISKGVSTGGKVFSKTFPNATKTIVQTTGTVGKKLEILNKPVSEVFSKTSSTEAVKAAEASLSQAEKDLLTALRKGEDPTKLYSDGGSQILGGLEEKGLVTPDQARQVTNQLTEKVNQAVANGADDAARKLRLQTGVQIQKVLVADSGSSGMAKSGLINSNRSLVTDADRSLMLKVDKDALAVYAHENQMTPDQAYKDLLNRYQNLMDDGVDQALKDQGFQNGAADVDYKSYAGIGTKAGPADAYPTNYTAARTEMGTTNVRSYSPNGDLTSANDTSGRAFLDELGLEQQKHTGVLPSDPAGKIDAGELKNIAGQQLNSAMNHEDVKSVAKALIRDNYVAGRQKILTDPTISQAAREIVNNPQDMNTILNKYGIKADEFINKAREQVQTINQGLQGGTP